MRRKLFNVTAAVLGFVAVATAASWFRSYFAFDRLADVSYRYHGDELTVHTRQFLSARGELVLDERMETHSSPFEHLSAERRRATEALPRWRFSSHRADRVAGWQLSPVSIANVAGFAYIHRAPESAPREFDQDTVFRRATRFSSPSFRWTVTRSNRTVIVPHWFVFLCSAVPAIIVLVRRVRESRHRAAGRCPTCGYDCRATPVRCPECGANLPSPEATTEHQRTPRFRSRQHPGTS